MRVFVQTDQCKGPESGLLNKSIFNLSLYFETSREPYFKLLNNVRGSVDRASWLDFFADAVLFTASQAVETAQQLLALTGRHREAISELGRAASSTLKVHGALVEQPVVNSEWLVHKTGLTAATVIKSLSLLVKIGIVRELTSQKRNRVFRTAVNLCWVISLRCFSILADQTWDLHVGERLFRTVESAVTMAALQFSSSGLAKNQCLPKIGIVLIL